QGGHHGLHAKAAHRAQCDGEIEQHLAERDALLTQLLPLEKGRSVRPAGTQTAVLSPAITARCHKKTAPEGAAFAFRRMNQCSLFISSSLRSMSSSPRAMVSASDDFTSGNSSRSSSLM